MNEVSSSGFVSPADYSAEWRDITLLKQRTHTLVYTATRYGRRFVLKANSPEDEQLTDYRLQQEREFQLGIQLVHPNIAATYSLEQIDGVGRCIVQEWIDGITLGDWLLTNPSRAARERVLEQLMDALEYVHGLQLVHHDLKGDNILVTRNGTNAKLIDFGLAALDSTLSPTENDPRTDIDALCRLFHIRGNYPTVKALRQALNRRKTLLKLIPVFLSFVLFIVAVIFFYLAWNERYMEKLRYDEMVALIDQQMALERAEGMQLITTPDSFEIGNATDMIAYQAYMAQYTNIRKHYWSIRDSIMQTYDESDPLREQFFIMWTHREMEMDNELYPQLTDKLKK